MMRKETRETSSEILSINRILIYLKQSAVDFFTDKPIDFSCICQWLRNVRFDSSSPIKNVVCILNLDTQISFHSPQLLLHKDGKYLFIQVKTNAGRVIIDYGHGSIDHSPQDNILHSLSDDQNNQEDTPNTELSTELLKFHIATLLSSADLTEVLRTHLHSMMEDINQSKLDAAKWLGELMAIEDEFIPNLQQKERKNFDKIVGILAQII